MMKFQEQWRRELKAIASFYREPRPLHELAKKIAAKHGITLESLRGDRRQKHLVKARIEFVVIATYGLGKSSPAIGRYLGDRDHSGILNLLRKARA